MTVVALDYRTPRQGERLTYDGRTFILTSIEEDCRGYWWKAIARDGRTTLAGNGKLTRCGLSNGWTVL